MDNNEIKARVIPQNVTDSGRIKGFIRTRNLIEGLVVALPIVFLLVKFYNPPEMMTKIFVVLVGGLAPIVISLLWVANFSPGEYLALILAFKKNSHYSKYNPRLKWDSTPEYLIHGGQLTPYQKLQNFLDVFSHASAQKDGENESPIDENIVNPTHDERFLEDRKYLEQHDDIPDELKSASQLRAEKRERKKRERELRAEDRKAIKEAKRAAKAERKKAKKKSYITENNEE